MMPLTGAGEVSSAGLFSTPDGSFPSGYYLGKDDKIMLMTEVINYSNATKNVYVVTEFDYIEGKPAGYLDSGVVMFSVNQCDTGNPILKAPAGKKKFSLKGTAATAVLDGYILIRHGHLHDGGNNIVMKLNGRTVCDSRAVYGQNTTGVDGKSWMALSNMTQCHEPIKVQRGDQMEVEAFFDLDKHPARKHAHVGMMGGSDAEEMGLMSFVFSPLGGDVTPKAGTMGVAPKVSKTPPGSSTGLNPPFLEIPWLTWG